MANEHRVIAYEGIRVPGAPKTGDQGQPDVEWITVPWKQFVGLQPDQQKQVLDKAGLKPDEQGTLLGLLQKNNNITWEPNRGVEFSEMFGGSTKGWTDPAYGKLSDQLMKEFGAKADADANKSLMGQIGVEEPSKVSGTDPGKAYPAYSEAALNAYTNNYVLPIQKQLAGMISGDMDAWQNSIQNIATATGQAGSPITQLIESNAKQMAPLMQLLGNVTNQAQLNAPYLNMVNQAIGAQSKLGAEQQALGQQAQALAQYGIIDPTTANLLNLSAGLGGTLGGSAAAGGAGGAVANPSAIQSLLSGLTPGVNANLPKGAG